MLTFNLRRRVAALFRRDIPTDAVVVVRAWCDRKRFELGLDAIELPFGELPSTADVAQVMRISRARAHDLLHEAFHAGRIARVSAGVAGVVDPTHPMFLTGGSRAYRWRPSLVPSMAEDLVLARRDRP